MAYRNVQQRRRSGGRARSSRICPNLEPLEERALLTSLTIAQENQLAGTPQSVWDISGAGDPGIQGFATDISVNQGQTVFFKINDTNRDPYRIDIYRMGYYQGNGARLVTTVYPSSTQLQNAETQPAPLTDPTTRLLDAGNWKESGSWSTKDAISPGIDATSGIYFAKVIDTRTGGASHIFFVVRDDSDHSQLLFKTSDSTWEAYNNYGGDFIENPDWSSRAFAASYNRPFNTRDTTGGYGDQNFVFNAEYPMVRWLEANGYDVSYFTDVDTNRYGALIKNHQVFLSVGHDEYWSKAERDNVEAARDAGVNLAFFSGNEIFRKTRWEPSIDGSGTTYRTLVIYNESYDNARTDPLDAAPTWTWTGTWRDARFSPPSDGGRPENALSGTMYECNTTSNDIGISLNVPASDANLRFWRNTSVANLKSGQVATLGDRVVGYETDEDVDNGFRPAGLIDMSSTTFYSNSRTLVPWGTEWGPGPSTHSITLYRSPSGALVFSAGTVQWSWGLDGHHDEGNSTPDVRMQQATVNLLADMGVQPTTLQSGLTAATASTDKTPSASTITAPAAGTTVQSGTPVTITGTATDSGGGVVGGVEVSVDGGTTWHPATGRESWSYTWTPGGSSGPVTIKSRAVDDSGNIETPGVGITVTVQGQNNPSGTNIFSATATPQTSDAGLDSPVEVGVKFRSDVAGYVTGIRFYKSTANTGTHIGNLWSNTGTNLASATFANETASGWQQVTFANPVPIQANTVYVASYHTDVGHYAEDDNYFTSGVDSGSLHALADEANSPNGVYAYGASGAFPNTGYRQSNYWVDVVFSSSSTTVATTTSLASSPNPSNSGQAVTFTATVKPSGTGTPTGTVTFLDGATALGTGTLNASGQATFTTSTLAAGTHSITAAYGGNADFAASTSAALTQTVNSSTTAATTTSLASSPNPSNSGQAVTFTATVKPSGTGTPTGTVTFLDGGATALGTGTLNASGQATFTTSTLAAGTHSITAAYGGNADFAASTSAALTQTVNSSTANVSLWNSSAAPTNPSTNDSSAVEVGVKFRSTAAGSITGIRFYKGTGNTGTHVGSLWTSTGTLLARATFTNETASGWQQVTFSNPVLIQPNTTYVASYHTNTGHYADDTGYFNTARSNGPLSAPANATGNPNGVYVYSARSKFPTNGWQSSNYWVDVVFVPS